MKHTLEIEMRDGSVWSVPVATIARNRAAHYADEFGGDVEKSLAEDTVPSFEADPYQIVDWAQNNMNWSDVRVVALKVREPKPLTQAEFQEGWVNGPHVLRDETETS